MNLCTQLLEAENETMRRIVHAIFNAITIDAPRERRENCLATNNRLICAVGDHINENLQNQVAGDVVELASFKRSAWEGKLIILNRRETTICIVRNTTLEQIRKKQLRFKPHYLQTLLYIMNDDLEASPKQQIIDLGFDGTFNGFTDEELAYDFERITANRFSRADHFKHYVIIYTAAKSELKDIRLVLLDKNFGEVASESLNSLIAPDFGALMAKVEEAKAITETEEPASKASLLKVRDSVKMHLRKKAEEA